MYNEEKRQAYLEFNREAMRALTLSVKFGCAVIPYGLAYRDLPEGWVLPGGRRTIDPLEAQKMAAKIDKAMRRDW